MSSTTFLFRSVTLRLTVRVLMEMTLSAGACSSLSLLCPPSRLVREGRTVPDSVAAEG